MVAYKQLDNHLFFLSARAAVDKGTVKYLVVRMLFSGAWIVNTLNYGDSEEDMAIIVGFI